MSRSWEHDLFIFEKLKVFFKKQPSQNINASLKKENQKLIQLIQSMKQSNGTMANSTITPACEQNCTKGKIWKVSSDCKYFLAKYQAFKDLLQNFWELFFGI